MTLPTSLLAYQDCTELFEKAIEDEFGIRFEVESYDAALHLQSRLHYCRKLHREENSRIYAEGELLHGRSVFDAVVCRIKNLNGQFFLYLERNDKPRGTIEKLSEIETGQGSPAELKVVRRV